MTAYGFTVWARIARTDRCWLCKQPIVVRVNRKTGKELPFNGILQPLHTFVEEDTGHAMEVLSRDDLHLATCKKRNERRPAAGARA